MKTKPTLRSFLTLSASTLLAVSYTHAANLTWDPDGDSAEVNPANATWSTAAGNLFWNNGGGVANVAWTTGNAAILGGSGGPFAITVGSAVTVQKITFASSSYTLTGANNVTITPASGNPLLQVDSGAVATIGAGTNIIVANSSNLGQATGTTAAGTLNIDGTNAVIRPSTNAPGFSLSGSGFIVNVKNGTLRTSTTATSPSITVGAAVGSDVNMNVSGGVVTVTGSGGLIVGGSGQGTVTQTGGTISIASTSTAGVSFAANAANESVNTFNLGGGTLNTPIVRKGVATTGTAVFNFNGGLLVANNTATTTTNATFMEGLDAANVKAGGARIQNANNIIINQALLEDADSPGGGLTKTGAGTLTLAGQNTYTGATTVTSGKLLLSTAGSGASDVSIASGATVGVVGASPSVPEYVNAGDLSLSSTSTLIIDYATEELSVDTAPLSVENFTLDTGINLLITGSVTPGPSYQLVTWTGSGPTLASDTFNQVFVNGLVGTLNISGNTLFVTFTAPPPISWNTGDGTWDTSASNWVDEALVAATFTDAADAVLFGDAAGVSGSPVVTLNSTLSPLGVTMNSTSRDYTISGSGTIAGPAGITLDSSNLGKLTLTNTNTYTGETKVLGGTLRLGDGGSTGSLATASPIISAINTSFEVNQSDTVTQGTDFGVISGAGGFAQTGAGTTVLNSVNTFTGATTITSGNLEIGANGRLGSGNYFGGIGISEETSVFQYRSTSTQTLAGVISGAGSLVKSSGSGILTLAAGNSYTGSTTVRGELRLQHVGALASTSAISLADGTAILRPNVGDVVIDAPITVDTAEATAQINAPFPGDGGEVVTLTVNGAISGAGNLRLFSRTSGWNANSTILLNAASTYLGNTVLDTAGEQDHFAGVNLIVKSGIENALPATTVLTIDGDVGRGTGRTASFDLNGFNQTLAGLTNVTGVATKLRVQRVTNTSETFATLTINNSADFSFGSTADVTNANLPSAKISGRVNLAKSGAGTFTLVGIHAYAGDTTVTEGILVQSAANNNADPLPPGLPISNDASTYTIAPTATLNLNFDGTDNIGQLFIGTTQQAAGVYGSIGSGAQFESAQITGTGTLTVASGSAPNGYAGWAATNAGGQASGLDFDNDGVANGVEFFMNAAAGFTSNPQLSTGVPRTITWPNGGNIPASAYGTQFVVQTSPDLTVWTDVLIGDLTTNTDSTLTYTLTGGSPRFVRLSVNPD